MTSDFDELASAYLDGEASDADRARIEADPSLLARVDELRTVSEALDVDVAPADEFLRRRQIGAALDAFDDLADPVVAAEPSVTTLADSPNTAAPVDLAGRRGQRSQDTNRSGRAGMPRWLGVAAVLLLLVGGIGLLAQLGGSSDDSLATASDSVEFDTDDASDALADEPAAEAAGEAQAARPSAGDDAEGAEATRAASDEETEAEAVEEAAGEDQAAADGGSAGPDTTSLATTSTAVGGFFPNEQIEAARVSFDGAPTEEELLALADGPRFDPALSECAAAVASETGVVIEFFVPIAVEGLPGEALFTGVTPALSAVAVDEACNVIE